VLKRTPSKPRNRVLVIDGNRTTRTQLVERLAEAGYEVSQLADAGREVIEPDTADFAIVRHEAGEVDDFTCGAAGMGTTITIGWLRPSSTSNTEGIAEALGAAKEEVVRIFAAIAPPLFGTDADSAVRLAERLSSVPT
jgi:hypothetical protein